MVVYAPKCQQGCIIALIITVLALIGAIIAMAATSSNIDDSSSAEETVVASESVNVVVIGGGMAGATMLARLSGENADQAILFESSDLIGGRLMDVDNPIVPGTYLPLGGMRLIAWLDDPTEIDNNRMLSLAAGLGIETAGVERDTVWYSRGKYSSDSDQLAPLFSNLPFPGLSESFWGGDVGPELSTWEWLLYGEYNFGFEDAASQYIPTNDSFIPVGTDPSTFLETSSCITSWIEQAAGYMGFSNSGQEAKSFLDETFSFSDVRLSTVDPASWRSWFQEEWDFFGTLYYPTTGMSSIPRALVEQAEASDSRVYQSEAVTHVDRVCDVSDSCVYPFRVTTSQRVVDTKDVIFALPANDLQNIEGDIASSIKSTQQYQDIAGVPVVTVAAVWPTRWWLENNWTSPDSVGYTTTEPDRISSKSSCLTMSSFPRDAASHLWSANYSRPVYTDDPKCVEMFQNCYETGGDECLVNEIMNGLNHAWPDVDIPEPVYLHYHYFEQGWAWLKAGTEFSNQDLREWGLDPLGDGSRVFVIGTSYNIQRAGWADGAYQHALELLNTAYGFNYDLVTGEEASAKLHSTSDKKANDIAKKRRKAKHSVGQLGR